MILTKDMRSFLVREFLTLSWAGSVQRAGLYREGLSESRKEPFKCRVRQYLQGDLLPRYANSCTEDRHYEHIRELSEFGSQVGEEILRDGRYRVGVAQKFLNLQLKYLWCLGEILEPPHCPVDRIVLGQTSLRDRISWTAIDSLEDYRQCIEAIRGVAKANGQSLAMWELGVFSAARP